VALLTAEGETLCGRSNDGKNLGYALVESSLKECDEACINVKRLRPINIISIKHIKMKKIISCTYAMIYCCVVKEKTKWAYWIGGSVPK
jgi:hypothetical protein